MSCGSHQEPLANQVRSPSFQGRLQAFRSGYCYQNHPLPLEPPPKSYDAQWNSSTFYNPCSLRLIPRRTAGLMASAPATRRLVASSTMRPSSDWAAVLCLQDLQKDVCNIQPTPESTSSSPDVRFGVLTIEFCAVGCFWRLAHFIC